MDNYAGQKKRVIDSAQPQKKDVVFLILADKVLIELNKRTQQIIKKRFGLSVNKAETLEKIGQQYNITRERVRQIITEASKIIKRNTVSKSFKKAEEKIIFTINQNNGIIKETDIAKKFKLTNSKEVNAIKFFLNYSDNLISLERKGLIEKSWVASQDLVSKIEKIILETHKIFKNKKTPLTEEEIYRKIELPEIDFSNQQIISYLKVASELQKNPFGKWGKSHWKEINPKGTREKAYLVLKERKEPLHFTQIARLIGEYKLSKKRAHPQTVHNELIKDEQFVLIGRGIYALHEWGYFPGTVREVLKKILEQSQKPLTKEKILAQVIKMRKVKKATVMINLNNTEFFCKQENYYTLNK